eukprot:CAMPEP_0194304364 /NCGR_PEP_ID=MMETSP0171-20130528/2133_1 /TAXON_ID=218684 /ORGANISM="Corethron pennatum, Strain L29A3" /LENGTH=414 /DNA_ID=CAMNT_0039055621 /DNA_START=158 /DNA_END=1402 /DNA_ORIENTATION=+
MAGAVTIIWASAYLLQVAQELYLLDSKADPFESNLDRLVLPPDARFGISQREKKITSSSRKIVILPGPHKTGSTSLQEFLRTLYKKGILKEQGWSHPVPEINGIKKLLYSDATTSKPIENWAQNAWDHNLNLVMTAEVLDVVAALSINRSRDAIGKILDNVRPKSSGNGKDIIDASVEVETVIMYRTPRTSQLVSVWTQQITHKKKKPFLDALPWRTSLVKKLRPRKRKKFKPNKVPTLAEWLCTGVWDGVYSYNMEMIISAQLNPFGVADAYARHGNATIKILDMSGVEDAPAAVACDVLHLNCNRSGKVIGVSKKTVFLNHSKKNPTSLGMDVKELAAAENILRRMDCHLYCALKQAKEHTITIIHAHDTMFVDSGKWSRCCESSSKNNLPTERAVKKLRRLGCVASANQNS